VIATISGDLKSKTNEPVNRLLFGIFAPTHLKRIKDAFAAISTLDTLPSRLSFAASGIQLSESGNGHDRLTKRLSNSTVWMEREEMKEQMTKGKGERKGRKGRG
jgi:hypothetical protein